MSIRVKIRQKGDREHLLLYYVDPFSGRERSRSAETANRKEAERAAAKWEAELLEFHGEHGDGWDAFKQRFSDEHLAFKATKTRSSYHTAFNVFEDFSKVKRLSQVTNSMMSLFAAELLKEDRPHTTVKSYLTHLLGAFRWAERIGLMKKAPNVRMPPTGKQSHSRGRPLSSREFGKMLKACRTIHGKQAGPWRYLLKLLWYSGLRIGEVAQLSWDMPPLVVRLDAKPYPLIVIDSEGQKSRADEASPIAPDFAAWLSRVPPNERSGFLVTVLNGSGKRYPSDKLSDEISRIGAEAKIEVKRLKKKGGAVQIKYASAHDLRRTFATRWAMKVRPMTLQRMMRHKDLSTTLRFYVGLSVEDVGAELWVGKRENA